MKKTKSRAKQLATSLRKTNSEKPGYDCEDFGEPFFASKPGEFKPSTPRAPSSNKVIDTNTQLLIDQDYTKKWANWRVRAISTFVLVAIFTGILTAGPLATISVVVGIQMAVFYEIVNLASLPNRQRKLPWLRRINWYFLAVTNYFLYGESIILNFKDFIFSKAFLLNLATHHRFISFAGYCVGFVWFVLKLRKGHYRFQFTMFAVTHMSLLLIVTTSQFVVANIFEGMFWFILPISLVIVNDIGAYVAGFFMGRTPLIELSPKKTWEGFVGGLFITVIFGAVAASMLSNYNFFICPVRDLSVTAFSNVECVPNPVFVSTEFKLSPISSSLLGLLYGKSVKVVFMKPILVHGIIMAIFASIIAPFGGFFASGFKRAFNIKDFANVIPGHGGLTDRFDCQFLMGLFSYIYFASFIRSQKLDVGTVLETIVHNLDVNQQVALYERLQTYLREYDLIPL